MARTRLTVDCDPKLNFLISRVASMLSWDQGRKVTSREVILKALARAHPELAEQVMHELQTTEVLEEA